MIPASLFSVSTLPAANNTSQAYFVLCVQLLRRVNFVKHRDIMNFKVPGVLDRQVAPSCGNKKPKRCNVSAELQGVYNGPFILHRLFINLHLITNTEEVKACSKTFSNVCKRKNKNKKIKYVICKCIHSFNSFPYRILFASS